MRNKKERLERLEDLLKDTVRYLKDGCFDKEDKEFFLQQGIKILTLMKDITIYTED